MKKVTLHVSGNVQRVGYRAKVKSIAKALGIKGSIQNLPDGKVKIIAQGKQTELDKLIHDINISNSLINVTNIEQEYSTPSDDYEDFDKVVGDGETDERLDNALDLFKKLIAVTEDGFNRLENKQDQTIDKISDLGKELGDKIDQVGYKVDQVGEKVDQVGDKVDQVGEKVDQVGEKVDQVGDKVDQVGDKVDQVGDKVDQVGDKVDQSRIEISSDIHSLRDDFNTLFDTRISKIEYELTEIKDKIVVLESSSSYNLTDKRKT
jgi:acylphosphatase/outer membrane murein-binding lipoprotein Lpp